MGSNPIMPSNEHMPGALADQKERFFFFFVPFKTKIRVLFWGMLYARKICYMVQLFCLCNHSTSNNIDFYHQDEKISGSLYGLVTLSKDFNGKHCKLFFQLCISSLCDHRQVLLTNAS